MARFGSRVVASANRILLRASRGAAVARANPSTGTSTASQPMALSSPWFLSVSSVGPAGSAALSAGHSRRNMRGPACANRHVSKAKAAQDELHSAPGDASPLFKDRLSPGGNWVGTSTNIRPSGTNGSAPLVIGSNPKGASGTYPKLDPIGQEELERFVDFVSGSRQLLVITGAGCSTESNIPDYRGPAGAYSSGYKPMTHQQFMANDTNRSRYWQRSSAGYKEFWNTKCNDAHHALARMESLGWVKGVITQNVDRLHHKAGSHRVIELHGTTHRVICTSCQSTMDRKTLQEIFQKLNADIMAQQEQTGAEANQDPALETGTAVKRPDGDTDATLSSSFQFPPCDDCGGILKPDVVFFGDNVPKDRADEALRLAEEADRILVVGSSLMVYSVFRLIKAAKARGAKLAILTAGPTRADDMANLKLEHLAGETLARVARHPTLSIPPGR